VLVVGVVLIAGAPGGWPQPVLADGSPGAWPQPALASDQPRLDAPVTRAWDGTTLDARVDGRRTMVGYLGAEAPAPNQPCGAEALARNGELAGGLVLLEADAAYEFDARGRRLYYAYAEDGRSIEETLIREGLARAVRTDAAHGADLLAAQAEAEAAGRGCLWQST
jgi:endonuclease YncB( thermonuclease family)